MYELRSDGLRPEIMLNPPESSNITSVLKFRLRCIREGKIGAVMLPFGQAFYVDAQGEYMDGKIPPGELELSQVLMELREAATARDAMLAQGEDNGTL